MTLTKSDIPLHIHKALHFAVLATLPFTTTLNNRIIILLGISMFFLPGIFDEIKATFRNKYFWLFSSPFIMVCLGMLYTEDLKYGFGYVERNAMLMVLPFVIFSVRKYLTERFIDAALWFWVVVISISCIVCHVPVISQIIEEGRPINDLWNYYRFNYTYLSGTIGINPGYLALYICFALAIMGYFMVVKKLSKWIKIIVAITFIYQFWFLFLLSPRVQILGLIIVAFFTIFFIAGKHRMIWQPVLAGGVLMGLMVLMVFLMPNLKYRMIDSPKTQIIEALEGTQSTGSFSSRFNLARCGFETLGLKEWMMGHGTGDAQKALVDCYTQKEDDYLIEHQFHIHNEFLNRLMLHGIGGLLVIVAMFSLPLWLALKRKDYLYSVLLILVILSMLPHNFLSMHKGVVFFAFMNALFFVRTTAQHDEH